MCARSSWRRDEGGMTLTECAVAMGVAVTLLLVLFSFWEAVHDGRAKLFSRQHALAVAVSCLEQATEAGCGDLVPGETRIVTVEGHRLLLTLHRQQAAEGLWRLEVTVSWDARGTPQALTLVRDVASAGSP
ncbi:hypothetical protein [Calditerricola satsumensis]